MQTSTKPNTQPKVNSVSEPRDRIIGSGIKHDGMSTTIRYGLDLLGSEYPILPRDAALK